MSSTLRGKGVQIVGLQELGDTVTMFTNKVQKVMIRKAAYAGGDVIKAAIQELAPVLEDTERAGKWVTPKIKRTPGYLKKHITRRGQPTSDGGFRVSIGPSPTAFYARFIETGTNHQPAMPFIRPGFDASNKKAVDAMVKSLDVQIAQELGR